VDVLIEGVFAASNTLAGVELSGVKESMTEGKTWDYFDMFLLFSNFVLMVLVSFLFWYLILVNNRNDFLLEKLQEYEDLSSLGFSEKKIEVKLA